MEVKDLQTGDVLLSLGTSQISKFISWAGECEFSHAVLFDGTDRIIEATRKGVGYYDIYDRLRDTDNFEYLEVYRYNPQQDPGKLQPVIERGEKYIGEPFAGAGSIAVLALVVVAQGKILELPADISHEVRMALAWLVKGILNWFRRDDANQFTCVELVYRSFQEAEFELQITPQLDAQVPWPDDLNATDLIKELLYLGVQLEQKKDPPPGDVNQAIEQLLAEARAELGGPEKFTPEFGMDELEQRINRVLRDQIQEIRGREKFGPLKPENITLLELKTSPSLAPPEGRLRMG